VIRRLLYNVSRKAARLQERGEVNPDPTVIIHKEMQAKAVA